MQTPQPHSIEANLAGYDIRGFVDRNSHIVEIMAKLNGETTRAFYRVRSVRSTRVEGIDFWLFEVVVRPHDLRWHSRQWFLKNLLKQ
jgi:hypothetical protein